MDSTGRILLMLCSVVDSMSHLGSIQIIFKTTDDLAQAREIKAITFVHVIPGQMAGYQP